MTSTAQAIARVLLAQSYPGWTATKARHPGATQHQIFAPIARDDPAHGWQIRPDSTSYNSWAHVSVLVHVDGPIVTWWPREGSEALCLALAMLIAERGQ